LERQQKSEREKLKREKRCQEETNRNEEGQEGTSGGGARWERTGKCD
jgi:hypothetical protein